MRDIADAASMRATAVEPAATRGEPTMDLPHAIIAGGLAARATDRRFRTTEAEIRAAEQRVAARRAALVEASDRRVRFGSGRHAAPPPARA